MKNLKVSLAKKYLNHFYEVLTMSLDKKEALALRKTVEKYEDISYLKNALNNEIKASYVAYFNENKASNIVRYEQLTKALDDFYKVHLEGKEIIDVPVIKKAVSDLDKALVTATKEEYLHDVNQLFEFKNNISVELDLYVAKHKSEEYMDMSIFHKSVTQIINDVKETLNDLIYDNQMEENAYYEAYINFVYQQYTTLFESVGNNKNAMPQWLKGLLFCAPWIIGFLLFTIYPLIQTLIFSFSKVNSTADGFITSWIGITNYQNVLTDTDFVGKIKEYLVEMVVYVPLITIFSLALAMLLNSKIKARGFFRSIFFLPVVITSGPVLTKLMAQGVTAMPGINTVFNIDEITSQMPELAAMAINILTSDFVMILWFSGIQILVFLTALQKIDKGVYEASAIDGANKWEQFWKVTLPAINPSIVINVVFTTVMQSIFALNPIIQKIQLDMNDTSEGKGYGFSSALAFVYFLIMIIVLVIFVIIFKKHERKGKGAH